MKISEDKNKEKEGREEERKRQLVEEGNCSTA